MAEAKPTIGFIGAGRVGSALALALSRADYTVAAVASRSYGSAERLAALVDGCTPYHSTAPVAETCDLVFITTPDDAIAPVAAAVPWRIGQMVVHCSGSLSAAVLGAARDGGALVGGLHPLQTFANAEQAALALRGSAFGVEAEEARLSQVLNSLVADLGGTAIPLRAEDKALYHASAVIACNYLVTLFYLAAELWGAFGVERAVAVQALLPLVQGTLANLEHVGLPDSLTGPIARGDVGTVRKHLESLAAESPALLSMYRELARRTVPIGREKGTLTAPAAERLLRLLGDTEGETCE